MDWVFLISTYLSENGFIHLRFVKIIEKDGRQDGKRESLYFISHELDSLRQKATLDRNEYEELVKKYTLTALMMTKALLYLSRIGGLGAIFLPVLVFMPDVTMYYFGERFEELDKKRKRDEHLVGHALGDEFSKFERFRMRCTLAIITGIWILLPIVINERNLPFSSLYSNYFLILSSEKSILFSVLITGKVILGTPVSPLVPNLQRQLSYGTLGLLFIAVIALNTNMTILLGILIIAYSFSQAGILASLARDSVCVLAIIYSTFMNDFSFGLLDYLFVASLIFIHSVGKNKPGAVKLYSIFNFM